MEYTIYQLEFKTGVHFGTGMLNESACTFKADQIFSALYIYRFWEAKIPQLCQCESKDLPKCRRGVSYTLLRRL